MKNAALLILLLVLAGAIYFQGGLGPIKEGWDTLTGKPKPVVVEKPRELSLFEGKMILDSDAVSSGVPWNMQSALDGASHEQIAAFRTSRVDAYSDLGIFPDDYDPFAPPHRQIYGQITAHENWLKASVYFVANPYQLITATNAPYVNALSLDCPGVEIEYNDGVIEETHTGAGAACWFDKVYDIGDFPGQVWLFTVNAWDAGFKYAYVDVWKSENILPGAAPNHITNTPLSRSYYFHVGQYGTNNISPRDERAWVTLRARNAATKIYVKLWQQKPASTSQKADFVYIILVQPV
ncbi:MAG: hypothetical protein ABIL58_25160 [Pseudomonadota bacterium]